MGSAQIPNIEDNSLVFLSPVGLIVFFSALPQTDCERRCSLFSSFFFLLLHAYTSVCHNIDIDKIMVQRPGICHVLP